MMMIKVVATNYVKEEEITAYLELCKELVSETVKEAGCICYELFQDNENKTEFSFIEEWESEGHLKAHMESEHFVRLVPQLMALTSKDMNVSLLTKVL